MLDFVKVKKKYDEKTGTETYSPDFILGKSKDLMMKGGKFYAVWDEEMGLWSTDKYRLVELIDKATFAQFVKSEAYRKAMKSAKEYSSQVMENFEKAVKLMANSFVDLDEKVIFKDTETKKEDYASFKLPYNLSDVEPVAWEKLVSTLYSPVEREKIEWAIGSIFAGDSKVIQKFFAFFGDPGTGKSTILNIIEKLFSGYTTTFNPKELVRHDSGFGTAALKDNPLLAIQHDTDLSRVADNSLLNSIIAHESVEINEKYKSQYSIRIRTMLFIASNKPIQITDRKSGLLRRLIDIYPSGDTLKANEYNDLMHTIDYELGAIANHCLNVYKHLGIHYYDAYKPDLMTERTDPFYNFVLDNDDYFTENDPLPLKDAFHLYKLYVEENNVTFRLPKYAFRSELENYFEKFCRDTTIDGVRSYNVYVNYHSPLRESQETLTENGLEEPQTTPEFTESNSILNEILKEAPAQYASEEGTPTKPWDRVTTTLQDIDPTREHYTRPPQNYIVIDFDLKENGEKSREKNLKAASKWPETYGEYSRSGKGVHLWYIYDGDPSSLSRIYEEDIEIKVFTGKSAIRRKFSYCNGKEIAHISSGLPLKGDRKTMMNQEIVLTEKGLRTVIARAMLKEYQAGTITNVNFIKKVLDDAYNDGKPYSVVDLRQKVLNFAMNSTHHSEECMKIVSEMHFESETLPDGMEGDGPIVFFDIEIFPNLFIVCFKLLDKDPVYRLINPTASDIKRLMEQKLVGFNNLRYDNAILYAASLGYTIEQLYEESKKIINGSKNTFMWVAQDVSYTDIYDFSAEKKSLKKFEIDLGIIHRECPFDWNKDVPEKYWTQVADYCCNDVIATEKVWHYKKTDWIARQILSDLSGLSVNQPTNEHAKRIIFEGDPISEVKKELKYTDLREMFPGYEFKDGKSYYRGFEVGEGGWVLAKPGAYKGVGLLDIESMHPTSIEELNLFGRYTKNFSALKQTRLAIKHEDLEFVETIFNGKLKKYVETAKTGEGFNLDDLSYALKRVINSGYGLTSKATNPKNNPFRDERNVDNIVAKRGALFMIDLYYALTQCGYNVIHVKTDSVKVENITDECVEFIKEFGKPYGYNFEYEARYERLLLVNKAFYAAKHDEFGVRNKHGKKANEWTFTGDTFKIPYVQKHFFTHEPITIYDKMEVKSVATAMYLRYENEEKEGGEEYTFVGKVGAFVPVKEGGGTLLRISKEGDKYSAVEGTKGYKWMEMQDFLEKNLPETTIDNRYFDGEYEKIIGNTEKIVDNFENFCNGGEFKDVLNQ